MSSGPTSSRLTARSAKASPGIIGFMGHVVSDDTLLFAQVRATHFSTARQVADELLAAADDPGRLAGVSPTLTRLRAADVLSEVGSERDAADALSIMRDTVRAALPGELELAQLALAKTLAEADDLAEVEAQLQALLRDPVALSANIGVLTGIVTAVAMCGHIDRALSWTDDALAVAGDKSARITSPARTGPDGMDPRMLGQIRERILQIRQRAEAAQVDPNDPAAMRAYRRRDRRQTAAIGSSRPWPAVVNGVLLWWPETEYRRVTGQLPEIAAWLGDQWLGHTALVETSLTADGHRQARGHQQQLVAADFRRFVQFLEQFEPDPREAPTMTAFAAAAGLPPVQWPPKRRASCWCGSGNRYQDCCASAGR